MYAPRVTALRSSRRSRFLRWRGPVPTASAQVSALQASQPPSRRGRLGGGVLRACLGAGSRAQRLQLLMLDGENVKRFLARRAPSPASSSPLPTPTCLPPHSRRAHRRFFSGAAARAPAASPRRAGADSCVFRVGSYSVGL